ncbi:MAG TPA: proton-conducting transporter membrane subunit [Rhizomicrobium sp.]|jgi:formate hydrogenlyase subunit 3/multisubunit Na+/H+ antiporter MnhD subunit|nr:proton-conducting transporter membrane subunit [Rhizomicrobium sp.]
MANEALAIGVALWLAAAICALVLRSAIVARGLLILGCVAAGVGAICALPAGSVSVHLPLGIAGIGMDFQLNPSAAWLLFFGLIAAALATFLGTPSAHGQAAWCFGAASGLIGAVGVFGLQDGIGLLVAWELMSLGGAWMILSERLARDTGRPVMFMLALLEFGSIALMLAVLLLAGTAQSFAFADFVKAGAGLASGWQVAIGMLFLVGFGAKIGLLPFYEWFPETYGAASGASGALLSGVILNAAFFALARALTGWISLGDATPLLLLTAFIVVLAVVTSILTALYAFQQEDWRALLGFSSAENGAIAVALLGCSLVFARDGLGALAGLAWIVALIHLAGHSIAKGGMFLAADGVFATTGTYDIRQSGILREGFWLYGAGALFAGMSLAAMPPQAGFVSEWYLFQTVFQGFHLSSLGERLLLVIAGAGFALTVAIALATVVKVLGIGLLGRGSKAYPRIGIWRALVVGALGFAVLMVAAGMPFWLSALSAAAPAGYANVAAKMRDGWLLVPLTSAFAFISPSKLVIVMPLLALLPILLLFASRQGSARRAPVWYGGKEQDPVRAATTALAFSNALRTFYSFVYRPTAETTRVQSGGGNGYPYFVKRLVFSHDVAPLFGPSLFEPLERLVVGIAARLRALQSGQLNFYLALIGLLLVIVLAVSLL